MAEQLKSISEYIAVEKETINDDIRSHVGLRKPATKTSVTSKKSANPIKQESQKQFFNYSKKYEIKKQSVRESFQPKSASKMPRNFLDSIVLDKSARSSLKNSSNIRNKIAKSAEFTTRLEKWKHAFESSSKQTRLQKWKADDNLSKVNSKSVGKETNEIKNFLKAQQNWNEIHQRDYITFENREKSIDFLDRDAYLLSFAGYSGNGSHKPYSPEAKSISNLTETYKASDIKQFNSKKSAEQNQSQIIKIVKTKIPQIKSNDEIINTFTKPSTCIPKKNQKVQTSGSEKPIMVDETVQTVSQKSNKVTEGNLTSH